MDRTVAFEASNLGSSPSKGSNAPIVYRIARKTSNLEGWVQFPVGVPKMEKIEMTDTEYLKWLSDYFKEIKDNLEEHIQIVIGEDGSGALYTLQELKDYIKG